MLPYRIRQHRWRHYCLPVRISFINTTSSILQLQVQIVAQSIITHHLSTAWCRIIWEVVLRVLVLKASFYRTNVVKHVNFRHAIKLQFEIRGFSWQRTRRFCHLHDLGCVTQGILGESYLGGLMRVAKAVVRGPVHVIVELVGRRFLLGEQTLLW